MAKSIAAINGEHNTRIWPFINHDADQAREQENHSAVTMVGVDETSSNRSHNYVTLLVNPPVPKGLFIFRAPFPAVTERISTEPNSVLVQAVKRMHRRTSCEQDHLPNTTTKAPISRLMAVAYKYRNTIPPIFTILAALKHEPEAFQRASVEKEHTLIFLTGFSGSGKSTIGPLLANSLGYDFVDLDQAIEEHAGKSINRIFAEEGEARFRKREQEVLESLGTLKETIVSLGGGVLENDQCHQLIERSGTLVYLKSSPASLAKRLQHKTDRPLLKSASREPLGKEALEERIRTILEQREPRYKSAAISVQTDQKRIGSTVEELTRKIERYLRKIRGTAT